MRILDPEIRALYFKAKEKRESLRDMYDVCFGPFNKKYFSGELKKPPLILLTSKSGSPWGQFRYPPGDQLSIALHTDIINSGFEDFRDTLLHEMAHQYQRLIIKDEGTSHNPVFAALAIWCGLEGYTGSIRNIVTK